MGSEVHGLHPDMPFREAAKPAIGQKLDELFEHEAGTRAGDDIEHLHDMRVASRRLRAAMDVFAPCFAPKVFRPLHKMAASLTRALGAVRDRDVLIESLEKYGRKAPEEERPGINDIVRTVRDEREVYRAEMLRVLDEVDRSGFRQHLYIVLMHDANLKSKAEKKEAPDPSAPLRNNARHIAVQRAEGLYSYVRYIYDPAQMAELHEMRIAAKHLRYALEIFRVCFGEDIDERIDDIKEVQEQVGNIHDCDVMVELLQRHLSVIAQRTHQDLAAVATEPGPHVTRMARIREAVRSHAEGDIRIGILSLLSHKTDERQRRYGEFVRWWDEQHANNMRGKLYSCIAAVNGAKDEA